MTFHSIRVSICVCLLASGFAFTAVPASAQSRTSFTEAWAAGTPRSVVGEVAVVVVDDVENHRSERRHVVRDDRTGQTFELRFESEPQSGLRSGGRVRFDGRVHGSELLIAGCCTASGGAEVSASAAASLTGDQRTLVMLANFTDASVSCSAAAINNAMFADPNGLSVDALYRASSLGRISISGQVIGPYVLNARSTDACDISGWADSVDSAAAASGVDVASYPRKVYVMPPNTCPGAGLGTVGSVESSRAWIFDCGTKGVFAHEIGHNLGMDHASTPTREYGDATDPMTVASWMLPGVNAPHREALGWLGQDASLVTASGVYQVAPLAVDPAAASAPRMLLLPKADTNERYYVSYRTPVGFDAYIDGTYHHQVSVHRYRGDGSVDRTFLLAGLTDGRSFTDSANGLTITLVSHDAARATVRVDFATPCVPEQPTLTLSPESQTAAAGGAVGYTVSVTNHDGPSCPSRVFGVSSSVPAGWAALIQPASVPVGAGATGQAVVTLTSAPSAPAGNYSATITVSDTTTNGASVVAAYAVQPPADSAAPSAPVGLKALANTKRKSVDLSWQAATDNRGVAGYRVLRNGVVVGTSTTTAWVDPAWSAGATYRYTVVAYDAAGNVSTPSAMVEVSLGGAGKKR